VAFKKLKQGGLMGRYVHTVLMQDEYVTTIWDFKIIAAILSTCASLRNLVLAVAEIVPEMMYILLNEHAPPTLRRIRIKWHRCAVPFTLSTLPQATLQNLTHLELYLTEVPSCNEPYWQPLRSTSLQYLSFKWWEHLNEDHISLIRAAFSQRPPSLKALIIALCYDYHHDENCLGELDAWFCKNQRDPKSSVVILAGLTDKWIADDGIQPTAGFQHTVWDNWAFVTRSPILDSRLYDLCEELLPDGNLTIWERADRALETRKRRLQLVSQVD
jgi:hypothetical protein